MQKILFVCTGNICRSPTAEGVLRHKLNQLGKTGIHIDSAGTHGYHIGEAPDKRSITHAKQRGIAIDDLRARIVLPEDFQNYDLILGLDHGHVRLLERMAPANSNAKIALFLDYAGHAGQEVPDPYYGSAKDFEHVLDLVEQGMDSLIGKLKL